MLFFFLLQSECSTSDFSEDERDSNVLDKSVGYKRRIMDGDTSESSRRPPTRVFKKSSPNGKMTVYLGKRDFVDHITHVDPIGKHILL